jgi:hypothetical protein
MGLASNRVHDSCGRSSVERMLRMGIRMALAMHSHCTHALPPDDTTVIDHAKPNVRSSQVKAFVKERVLLHMQYLVVSYRS